MLAVMPPILWVDERHGRERRHTLGDASLDASFTRIPKPAAQPRSKTPRPRSISLRPEPGDLASMIPQPQQKSTTPRALSARRSEADASLRSSVARVAQAAPMPLRALSPPRGPDVEDTIRRANQSVCRNSIEIPQAAVNQKPAARAMGRSRSEVSLSSKASKASPDASLKRAVRPRPSEASIAVDRHEVVGDTLGQRGSRRTSSMATPATRPVASRVPSVRRSSISKASDGETQPRGSTFAAPSRTAGATTRQSLSSQPSTPSRHHVGDVRSPPAAVSSNGAKLRDNLRHSLSSGALTSRTQAPVSVRHSLRNEGGSGSRAGSSTARSSVVPLSARSPELSTQNGRHSVRAPGASTKTQRTSGLATDSPSKRGVSVEIQRNPLQKRINDLEEEHTQILVENTTLRNACSQASSRIARLEELEENYRTRRSEGGTPVSSIGLRSSDETIQLFDHNFDLVNSTYYSDSQSSSACSPVNADKRTRSGQISSINRRPADHREPQTPESLDELFSHSVFLETEERTSVRASRLAPGESRQKPRHLCSDPSPPSR